MFTTTRGSQTANMSNTTQGSQTANMSNTTQGSQTAIMFTTTQGSQTARQVADWVVTTPQTMQLSRDTPEL